MTDAARKRWLRKLARDTDRARLVRARRAVQEARQAQRTCRARARAACKRARVLFGKWRQAQRAEIKRRIAGLRVMLRAATSSRRTKLAACCGKAERLRVRAHSDAQIAKARAELAELVSQRRAERLWTRGTRAALKGGPMRVVRDRESDHSVEVNLSPEELIVWAQVKSRIHATDRMTRTEAFQHWLHEHSSEVGRIVAEDAEQAYRRAVRDEKKERARAHRPRSDRELAAYVAHELADVPF